MSTKSRDSSRLSAIRSSLKQVAGVTGLAMAVSVPAAAAVTEADSGRDVAETIRHVQASAMTGTLAEISENGVVTKLAQWNNWNNWNNWRNF